MKVYFDNAATTPLDKEVLDEMLPYLEEHFGNPSSIHSIGRKTRTAIESARKKVAKLLNASPSEIFFTSGGTEADNMAIHCSIRDLSIKHAITSRIEHPAVLLTLQRLEKEGIIKLSFVNLKRDGHIDLNHLGELLEEHRKKEGSDRCFVSFMHANNEIGNLLPIKEVGEICLKYNAIFHSDTVQTIGNYSNDLQKLNVHFITTSAHKFHGPKGVGLLYIKDNIKIKPLIYGGSQERNMRGGTENLYGIVGLAKALEIAMRDLKEHQLHISKIKNYMKVQLLEAIPGIEWNGDPEKRSLYTVLNVSFPPIADAEMLLFNLDIAGIAVSGGSACASGSNKGSHVLEGICADMSRPAIRFSFSKYNTREEVDYTVNKLKALFDKKNIMGNG